MSRVRIYNKTLNANDYVLLNDDGYCPICGKGIVPEHLFGVKYKLNGNDVCSFFERCPSCNETFINSYSMRYDVCKHLIRSEPKHFEKQVFNSGVSKLSEKFVEIYNQSLHAEKWGLTK